MFPSHDHGGITIYELKNDDKVLRFMICFGVTVITGMHGKWIFNQEYKPSSTGHIVPDDFLLCTDYDNDVLFRYNDTIETMVKAFNNICDRLKHEKEKLKPDDFKYFYKIVSYFDKRHFKLKAWLECYDKLVRIDKHTEDDILWVVQEFRKDGNWWKDNGNFESFLKLRRTNSEGIKFMDIFLQKLKGKNKNLNVYRRHDAKQREY